MIDANRFLRQILAVGLATVRVLLAQSTQLLHRNVKRVVIFPAWIYAIPVAKSLRTGGGMRKYDPSRFPNHHHCDSRRQLLSRCLSIHFKSWDMNRYAWVFIGNIGITICFAVVAIHSEQWWVILLSMLGWHTFDSEKKDK